jgi:hypothetical protein
MASLKYDGAHMVDLTQLVALAARSQPTTHEHASR